MGPELLASLAVWFVAFLFSTTCHEAAHALVGRLGGDDTASSQVTLDPIPHIKREPFGMIVAPILSFVLGKGGWMIGWASAPYNPQWAARYPKRAALMAAAGPSANFVLALVAALAIRFGLGEGHFILPLNALAYDNLIVMASGSAGPLTMFLSVLFSLNLVLGVFNLIPVPPLDGHAIVPLFLTANGRRKWFSFFAGQGGMIGLLIAWVAFDKIFGPVFRVAHQLLLTGL